MAQSLFEKYGGFGRVHQVVMDFYDRVLDDDDLGPYFDDVDMKDLIDHQTKFISSLLGGPASYTDHHIRHAHKGLKIVPQHFDTMKRLMEETLREAGFEVADIQAALEQVESHRDTVLDR